MEQEKIRFKDLSISLKIFVILGWGVRGLFALSFLIGIILAIFLILSIIFYIGGYLMFLYEIVMEYHKRKWSEPIDEEIVYIMGKAKRIEKRIIKKKE